MSKRFIDTEMFRDPWFLDLSKDAKLLYIYLITNCNHAGIIKLNIKLIKFETELDNPLTVAKELGNRLLTVSEGLCFLPKFIDFQYPNFPNSKVLQQKSAIEIMQKLGIFNNGDITVNKHLVKSYVYVNDNVNVNNNKGVKKFKAPEMQEFIEYFEENKFPAELAIRAWKGYDEANWVKANGNKIINWKQTCQQVWFKDDNKPKKKLGVFDRPEFQ